jgi:hypothetical protein
MKLLALLTSVIALLVAPTLAAPGSEINCRNGDTKCLAGETTGICWDRGWHVVEACKGPYAKCLNKPTPHCTHGV